MFDEYFNKLKELKQDAPKIFERTAIKGAVEFVNAAKKITDEEDLVDTGNYKRNWYADATTVGDKHIIYCENSVDYASHLEEGHKTLSGGRVKGHFVGRRAIDKAFSYCVDLLDKAIASAMKKK